MNEREAMKLLPPDCVTTSTFGNPGEGGYTAFFKAPNGERWEIGNGGWNAPGDAWYARKVDKAYATVAS